MRVMQVLLLVAAAAALVGCASSPTPVSREEKIRLTRENWTPGSAVFVPADTLKLYPCHSAELPCGQLPPPAIERVTFNGPLRGDPVKGEAIAINVRYGNCIACHHLPKGHEGGTIGPDLREYGKRNEPLGYTYQRIWDVRAFSPNAFMPIYGPNGVLTEQEIHDVIAFLQQGR